MSDAVPPPQTTQRVELNYAQPVGKARVRVLIIGLVASAFFAFGAGMFAVGMTLREGDRDAPTFVGVGVSVIVLTAGCLTAAWVARR